MSINKMRQIDFTPKDVERFHTKYDLNESGCWLWNRPLADKGYARFAISKCGEVKIFASHRVSYTMLVGPIPAGLVLDHLCRVRHCVNPAHLEPVTVRENVQRGLVGVATYGDACTKAHGTEYRAVKPDGGTYCRRCATARQRAHRLGITTREAIEREAELDTSLTRKKPRETTTKPRMTLDWTNPRACLSCNTPIRRRSDPPTGGTIMHAGRGKCAKCLKIELYGVEYNQAPVFTLK